MALIQMTKMCFHGSRDYVALSKKKEKKDPLVKSHLFTSLQKEMTV